MNDDDLLAPKLSAPPTTSPLVRGAAVVMVTVAVAASGCGPSNPGAPLDGGNPGITVHDAGITVSDAGIDAPGNPGLPPLDAGP